MVYDLVAVDDCRSIRFGSCEPVHAGDDRIDRKMFGAHTLNVRFTYHGRQVLGDLAAMNRRSPAAHAQDAAAQLAQDS